LLFSFVILFATDIKQIENKCNSGDLQACLDAGNYYGTEQNLNPKKSIKYFSLACNKGNAKACAVLGFCYQSNWFGYEKNNKKKAVELFKKSCNGNSGYGCWYLANTYFEGIGVPKNKKLACKYWKKTIALKDPYW